MKTKFDTGERVLVPAKVNHISIEGQCVEYYVTAEKGYIGGANQLASMRIKEEKLVGLTDGLKSIHEKLRDIVEWVNASSNHHIIIERDSRGKIVKAMLEVTRE